jgi:stress response protein YsnF/sporulation protein YlmC with PRC-barrel domain
MASDHGQLLRRDVVSTDGADLGQVADVYVDARSGAARWLVVRGGVLSTSVCFVPADGTREDDAGRLVVAYTRRQVRRAPRPPADGDLTTVEEAALARHYASGPAGGLPRPTEAPAWLADPTTASEDSLVRAEEEVEVESKPRPSQRARLVKRVITEDVTFTVPLRREVLRLEYEDIDEADADEVSRRDGREPFGPVADHEVVLYAEVVEYEKKVVPKERVRLQHEVEPAVVDLRTDVRKEQVDVADAPVG